MTRQMKSQQRAACEQYLDLGDSQVGQHLLSPRRFQASDNQVDRLVLFIGQSSHEPPYSHKPPFPTPAMGRSVALAERQ